jgi:hypothetical protein
MECHEVRDRFSSLLEGDLKPQEEEKIREHLASCDSCRKDWDQFSRMIDWLHTVGEEEAPEGFLSEIQEKREERGRKKKWEGVQFLRTMKIPIQAAAMVMILSVVLYLTKMAPFDTLQKREAEKTETLYSETERKESIAKGKEKQTTASPPSALYRKDYASEAKPSAVEEKESPPAPPLKGETSAEQPSRAKEMAKAEAPPLEELKKEDPRAGKPLVSLAQKRIRETTLKIDDREKAFSRLQELAKQLGGEMVKEGDQLLLASIPASSFAEFEKRLAEIGSLPAAPQPASPKEMEDDLRVTAGARSIEPIFIRIHLVLE